MDRRNFLKTGTTLAAGGLAVAALPFGSAQAQARKETLLVVAETGPNSLDIHGVGANSSSYQVAWNCYDRLLSYGRKTMPDGSLSYDGKQLVPELAEAWSMAPDGMSMTFKLRPDATFHDGSPVTATDVKWSFDRAVTIGGFPTFQMKAGSLEKPEQFVVVDDHTFRIDLLRADKLTTPDLTVPVAIIINSTLAKKNATAADPWAQEYLKSATAGGGAYKVDSWKPGQETVYSRFDGWKSGPLPALRRIIVREVPSPSNRRALLERGDADVSFDLPKKDFSEMMAQKKVTVVNTPVENAITYIGMNCTKPPFNNLKVRQAVAYALPYQKIMDAALFGLANPMFGGTSATPTTAAWPQPLPYNTDIAKAKALLAEAGYPEGFETVFSFDLGQATVQEPMAILIQEALGQIGIKMTIEKVPGATWRSALLKKDMPIFANTFGGWLNFPDYFFFWTYHGQNAVFNTMSYQNPAMDKLIDEARFAKDPVEYDKAVKGFIGLAFSDIPRMPLFQPYLTVALQPSVTGYQYWFHRGLDYRQLVKA
ncbi:MAG TPA: ABC transporter substrate-binding protein [Stellaceae bacterium]|nr:ABC transporter substrate-binding protein [Stellaceae bacterium]